LFGFPDFYNDKNMAANVNIEMLYSSKAEEYNKELNNLVKQLRISENEYHLNLAKISMVLTPDEICKAALRCFRE